MRNENAQRSLTERFTRRDFLARSALASAGLVVGGRRALAAASPNEKLNLGVVGVGGRGGENLKAVSGQNIVALCDVDSQRLAIAAKEHPKAKTYSDWRRMLEQTDIEAVVVSSPDHTHAVIIVAALKSGRHVYSEKPLTHTVSEARIVRDTARKYPKLATQMGTQIHAGNNYRRVVEAIQAGMIGDIKEVHVWQDYLWDTMERPTTETPPPAHLDWDLWLGPAPYRPYSPEYAHFKWRRWWDFGGGTLADFGCHHMDLSHWALKLRYPLTIEAEGPPVHPECAPPNLIVRYEYPGRGNLPPVKLAWYHTGKRPPQFEGGQMPKWGSGSLFVGAKGMILADYNKHVLLPEKDFAGVARPPKTIPDSIGHHAEWIQACKTGSPTTCNFEYGTALTETVLLGNVAFRAGKKLEWDAEKLKARNCPEADPFIQHRYRVGWTL